MENARFVLNKLAGNPAKIGYRYMTCAVEIVLRRGEFPYRALMDDLYPSVAEIYHVNVTQVSREVARAVEDCWDSGNHKYLEELVGRPVTSKPTPGQLIAQIANYVSGKELTVV